MSDDRATPGNDGSCQLCSLIQAICLNICRIGQEFVCLLKNSAKVIELLKNILSQIKENKKPLLAVLFAGLLSYAGLSGLRNSDVTTSAGSVPLPASNEAVESLTANPPSPPPTPPSSYTPDTKDYHQEIEIVDDQNKRAKVTIYTLGYSWHWKKGSDDTVITTSSSETHKVDMLFGVDRYENIIKLNNEFIVIGMASADTASDGEAGEERRSLQRAQQLMTRVCKIKRTGELQDVLVHVVSAGRYAGASDADKQRRPLFGYIWQKDQGINLSKAILNFMKTDKLIGINFAEFSVISRALKSQNEIDIIVDSSNCLP